MTDKTTSTVCWRHDVVECSQGVKALRRALTELDAKGIEVVSVIQNTGGPLMSMIANGDSFGLLIVTRERI